MPAFTPPFNASKLSGEDIVVSSLSVDNDVTSEGNLLLESSQPEIRLGLSGDVVLMREDTNLLALKRGTNSQSLLIFKTWIDGSNYEYTRIGWNGSAVELGTAALGSGTVRPIALNRGATTHWLMNSTGNVFGAHLLPSADNTYNIGAASGYKPANIYAANSIISPVLAAVNTDADHTSPVLNTIQTWDSGTDVFTAFSISITDTSSGDDSLLADWKVDGTSKFTTNKDGTITNTGDLYMDSSQPEIRLGLGGGDVVLMREDTGLLALKNGTSSQSLLIFKTWTDGNDHEYTRIGWNGSAVEFGTKAGFSGGTVRPIALNRGATTHWLLDSTGNVFGAHLLPSADNTYDIGASAGAKPRNIYVAGALNTGGGVGVGASAVASAWAKVAAGTTSISQLNLATGVAPASPNDGDIWFDGTDLKMRVAGVTKTFTLA